MAALDKRLTAACEVHRLPAASVGAQARAPMDIARSDAVPAGAIPAVADIPGVRDRRLQTYRPPDIAPRGRARR